MPLHAPARQAAWALPAIHSLESGDLIFRRGLDGAAQLVLSQQDAARFSHVGMLWRDGNQLWVVHALPEHPRTHAQGVQRETLASFLDASQASQAAIYRLPLVATQRGHIAAYLRQQLGVPFDHDYSLNSAQTQYCSELILRALQQVNVTLKVTTLEVPLLDEPVVSPESISQLPQLLLLWQSPVNP